MFDPMFMLVTALAFAVFAGLGLAFTADEAQERAAKRAKSMGRPEAVQRGKTRAAPARPRRNSAASRYWTA